MNDNSLQDIEMTTLDPTAALNQYIGQWNFVNVGVIKEIHNDDYVDVRTYYLDNLEDEVVFTDVRLLHVGTAKCKLNIKPTVGDNVLLLCPKDFIEKLKYNEDSKISEYMFKAYTEQGMCGIIIKAETDEEVLTTISIDDEGNVSFSTRGTISAKKTKESDGDEDETLASLDVDADGNVSASTRGTVSLAKTDDSDSPLATLDVDGDGNISAHTEESVELTAAKDGTFSFDGDFSMSVKGSVSISTDKGISVSAKEDITIDTDKDLSVSADNIPVKCSKFTVSNSSGVEAFSVTP